MGGVTYNTLNNIVFSNSQPALKAIKDNIGPRVGIAWGFLPKTVMRVGYGIFYDTISYRSQYVENTRQGSIWPLDSRRLRYLSTPLQWGRPDADHRAYLQQPDRLRSLPGGYATSQLSGLVGSNPIVVAPWRWA